MNAKKCDRCGKFYEIDERDYTHIIVAKRYRDDGNCYDVCPDCMKEFKTWFAAPEASVEHGKEIK